MARPEPAAPYPADLFVAVHSGNPGDVYFYRRACTEAERVLELGCGAGRIACALSADGLDVTGVESDPDLLALAPPCGARLLEADFGELDLDERFDRVIAPYNALYCLLDREALRDVLARAHAHLREGGLLVFDGWAADRFHHEADPDAPDDFELVKSVQARGRTWDVYERSDWDPGRQRIDAHYRHVPRGAPATPATPDARDARDQPVETEAIEATIPQRYLLSDEVEPLLEQAGFDLLALLGAFDDEAFDEDSDHLIVVASAG